MFSKWKISKDGMSNYRFGEDKELYRLPFIKGKRSYGLRKIKMQHPNRYLINGEMWSKDQLRPHLVLDDNPIELTKSDDMPF